MSPSTGVGRPRTACQQCKRLKVSRHQRHCIRLVANSVVLQIRCSGDFPHCKRCTRLNQDCRYGQNVAASNTPSGSRVLQSSASDESGLGVLGVETPLPLLPTLTNSLQTASFLGIPEPLMLKLIDTYFLHVYNARLFLHRDKFLQAQAAGTNRPCLLLSICAFGSV